MTLALNLSRRLSSLLAGLVCVGALTVLPAHAAKDNPECEANPLFSRFPGEVMEDCERSRFKAQEFWRWRNPARKDAGGVDPFTVEGEYWKYHNPLDASTPKNQIAKLEVLRNIEMAVLQAKGTVLYRDGAKSVTYHIKKGGDDFWGQSGCGRGDPCEQISHTIIRVAGMEQSIVVTADQIAKAIGSEGKVVFYGIYFDHNKATVKPESAPSLAEMAKWLKANASARVFIVGHTDMQGSSELNQKLSQDRAAAVVAVLTKEHGIKADRLAPAGVGPLAPVASNANEAGRAKNRRVEMVLR